MGGGGGDVLSNVVSGILTKVTNCYTALLLSLLVAKNTNGQNQ